MNTLTVELQPNATLHMEQAPHETDDEFAGRVAAVVSVTDRVTVYRQDDGSAMTGRVVDILEHGIEIITNGAERLARAGGLPATHTFGYDTIARVAIRSNGDER